MTTPFHLLIIDDHLTDLLLLQDAIESQFSDVQLSVAQTAEAATAHLTRPDAPTPHLILLDLFLPGDGGLSVLRRLKAEPRTRGIPVVILTISAAPADIRAAYAEHASGYLVKPLLQSELERQVLHLIEHWRGARTAPPDPPGAPVPHGAD